MTDKKTLTLDISKWRCGLDSDNALGKGPTKLLNKEGYMCCLGQFALQLGYSELSIKNQGMPSDIGTKSDKDHLLVDERGLEFSIKAAAINDDEFTTPKQKIRQLKELCEKYGYTLQVVNEDLLP